MNCRGNSPIPRFSTFLAVTFGANEGPQLFPDGSQSTGLYLRGFVCRLYSPAYLHNYDSQFNFHIELCSNRLYLSVLPFGLLIRQHGSLERLSKPAHQRLNAITISE